MCSTHLAFAPTVMRIIARRARQKTLALERVLLATVAHALHTATPQHTCRSSQVFASGYVSQTDNITRSFFAFFCVDRRATSITGLLLLGQLHGRSNTHSIVHLASLSSYCPLQPSWCAIVKAGSPSQALQRRVRCHREKLNFGSREHTVDWKQRNGVGQWRGQPQGAHCRSWAYRSTVVEAAPPAGQHDGRGGVGQGIGCGRSSVDVPSWS